MTSSLPPEVQQTFDRFITCEFTTIGARKQPITWPVTPYYEPGGPTIDVTTGLGYPKKADDARGHPSVSLLFSDPTGCRMERPPQILVQGTAEVNDRDLEANRERYWRESAVKLPGTKGMHPPKAIRGLFNWYYTRIYVLVRPERIFVWPEGDISASPELFDSHIEEVRSGHIEEPELPHEPPEGGPVPWNSRIEELGGQYPTAVLSWTGPDGFPFSARVPVRADRTASRIRIEAEPVGLPFETGLACVAAHEHAPDFTWQRNFQVRGDLVEDDDGWAVVPHKVVGGFEVPKSQVAMYRENARKIMRFRKIAKRERARRVAR